MSAARDVVVIGGGIIGSAVALETARRGQDVMLVERDSPGRRASWAAAGMLSPLGEAPGAGPFLELADASLTEYAGFVQRLREDTGIDVEYRTNGKLHVAFEASEEPALHALGSGPLAERFDARVISAAEARALEPELAPQLTLAVLVGRDHRVNNRLLAQALTVAVTRRGVTLRTGTPTAALESAGGHVTGIRLASGEKVGARHVVIAAGSWSGELEGLPRSLPVFPVKGQMLAVDGRSRTNGRGARPPIERVVHGTGAYLIPREDGRVLIGATVEHVGYRKGPTPRGVAGLIAAAARMVPLLADLPLVETWAGFRPGTPDDMPILGAEPELGGLYYATGHFRNGILLAPLTARVTADLIAGGPPAALIAPFSIARFS